MENSGQRGQGLKNWLKAGLVVVALSIGGVSATHVDARSHAELAKRAPATQRFPTATNSLYMVPLYPTATNAAYSTPKFNDAAAPVRWPTDTFKPANPQATTVRSDRPRLIAPAYKWNALPSLINADPYMKYWHESILANATAYFNLPPVKYFMDGGSGILDNAREIKMRIKAFAYSYRMTQDLRWVSRTWAELQNASGKGPSPFGSDPDRWNSRHFLDAAEFSAAFAIAYDWLYDQWTTQQKTEIRDTLIKYGLKYGIEVYTGDPEGRGWWRTGTKANWNCVCNNGLTMGALAILGDDTTGTAKQLLGFTINNALQNCALAPSSDGTWSETAHYWYFGTSTHAEMTSSLMTATGSNYGLLTDTSTYSKTGDYHMYAYGPTSLFEWGDHGPNKFSITANAMVFYGSYYNRPEWTLFQRDRYDAADPWNMFWYDPSVSGAWWNGLSLDKVFGGWVSMRSSWTDINALFVAMKGGKNTGRYAHNDLDAGDFVLDAMGVRWAGELGSADYNHPGYFDGAATASRWKYYRKMTEGQNTILINKVNQLLTAAPVTLSSGSTGTKQGSSPKLTVGATDTSFWVTDLMTAYSSATVVKRGVRLLNGRKQVLIQDEITATAAIQWRMHTNATITLDSTTTATLVRNGKTMKVSILSPTTGATFATSDAVRFSTDPVPPQADQPNPGIKVLIVNMAAGTRNLQVLFNPQWNDGTVFVKPKSVALSSWTLTSHN